MKISTPNFRFFQRNKRQAALNLSKLAKEYAVQFLRINVITLNWKIYGKFSETPRTFAFSEETGTKDSPRLRCLCMLTLVRVRNGNAHSYFCIKFLLALYGCLIMVSFIRSCWLLFCHALQRFNNTQSQRHKGNYESDQ